MRVNDHYLKLKAGYLFPEISRRVDAFLDQQPEARDEPARGGLIKLGIGDVTEPLPQAVIEAMHEAVDDQAHRETFHGYGPYEGYPWLREKIVEFEYTPRRCEVHPEEVFISDGSKCDGGNLLDILASGRDAGDRGVNRVAVQDPVYPIYVDTNVMAGNTGGPDENGEYAGLTYLRANEHNAFEPPIPDTDAAGEPPLDVIYLCYPNNPTGVVASHGYLRRWVDYALRQGSLIVFDAAYEAFIDDTVAPPQGLPHSIYEIDGARSCAIELRSFSKKAGFTGTRCAWAVVPQGLTGRAADGSEVDVHRLWSRRQTTRFNGVSYIVQRAAEAVYTPAGREQTRELVQHYMANAEQIRRAMLDAGFVVFGGVHAPYVWVQGPRGTRSWELFDRLLNDCRIVATPGVGFGTSGEGYIRISAFNSAENVKIAMDRIVHVFASA